MNKYLLMSAAAALATTAAGTAANASSSVHYGTASGGSYCDGARLNTAGNVYAGSHVYTTCSFLSNPTNLVIEGLGFKKGTPPKKGKGGNVNLADTTFAYNYHENYAISFDLATPVQAGGTWALWIAFSSSSSFIGNEGVLLPGQFAKQKPGVKTTSSVSKIVAAMKAHGK